MKRIISSDIQPATPGPDRSGEQLAVPVYRGSFGSNRREFLGMMATLLVGVGCKKFLTTTPTDFVSPVNYFKNASEVNSALNGVYNVIGLEAMWGSQIPIRQNIGTDESFFSYTKFPTGPFFYNFDASDPYVLNTWRNCYIGVERANLLLANIDGADMDQTDKDHARGEALFLRAFYYYTLVQYYGDVPLKLQPTSSVNNVSIAATPAKDVYTQILADLTEAEGLVATATEIGYGGRVSKSAVRGILARVCLTMAGNPLKDAAKFQDALNWAGKVIDSGEHTLNPDYSQFYINFCQDLYDVKDSIWEVELYGNNNDANRQAGRIGNENGISHKPSDFGNIGYAYGFNSTTWKLYNLFEDADLRRDWSIAPFSYSSNSNNNKKNFPATSIVQRSCAKWRREYELDAPMNKNYTPINFPMLRYSDVLLMFAEAENEVNGPTEQAYEKINQVRERGYGKLLGGATNPEDAHLPAGLDKNGFRKAIQDERARELCFEGLRKHDLVRWGTFLDAMKETADDFGAHAPASYAYAQTAAANASAKHLLYPKPTLELALNKALKQNPGW